MCPHLPPRPHLSPSALFPRRVKRSGNAYTVVFSSVDGLPFSSWLSSSWTPSGSEGCGAGCLPAGSSPGTCACSATCWSLRPPVEHSLPSPSLPGIICRGISFLPPPPSPPARPKSGMTQDPPWAPLPAHPWSCPQSPVLKGEGSLQMLLNASPQHPPGDWPRVLWGRSTLTRLRLHEEGRHQACCVHCCASRCIRSHDPATGHGKGSPPLCGEM